MLGNWIARKTSTKSDEKKVWKSFSPFSSRSKRQTFSYSMPKSLNEQFYGVGSSFKLRENFLFSYLTKFSIKMFLAWSIRRDKSFIYKIECWLRWTLKRREFSQFIGWKETFDIASKIVWGRSRVFWGTWRMLINNLDTLQAFTNILKGNEAVPCISIRCKFNKQSMHNSKFVAELHMQMNQSNQTFWAVDLEFWQWKGMKSEKKTILH